MSILNTRAAIASFYRNALPGVTVEEKGGPFTEAEIDRWTAQAPALIVACLGVPSISIEGGMSVANVAWGVYATARNVPNTTRDAAPLTLVSAILASLPMNRWPDAQGVNTANKMPQNIAAVNLYSSKIDAKGLSLWAVRWQQAVDLPIVDADELDAFVTMTTEYKPSTPVDTSVVSMNGSVTLETT